MKILFCSVTCSFTVRANVEKKILQILHHLIQDEETPYGCLQRPSVISSFHHKKQKGSVRGRQAFFPQSSCPMFRLSDIIRLQ